MEEKPVAVKITLQNQDKLIAVYKEVFSGHPWHEDLICSNSKKEAGDARRCMIQYTTKHCCKYDFNKKNNQVDNDCRGEYIKRIDLESRQGVVLLPETGLERCVGCGEKLELIKFYPDFADHVMLIDEAVKEPGFVGYMAISDGKPIGFSWGYRVPEKRTVSVNFPLIMPLLEKQGIKPEEVFYCAEIGIIDKFQRLGLGSAISAFRLRDVHRQGYKTLLTRTINPYTHAILEHIFSEKPGQQILKDPERGSLWFKWDFNDFNEDYTEKVVSKLE